MSRVSLFFDDGTKIDFNNRGDALYHLKAQGYAGVVELVDEDTGEQVHDREELEGELANYDTSEE